MADEVSRNSFVIMLNLPSPAKYILQESYGEDEEENYYGVGYVNGNTAVPSERHNSSSSQCDRDDEAKDAAAKLNSGYNKFNNHHNDPILDMNEVPIVPDTSSSSSSSSSS
eukprot:CAMPEP_0174973604 /NCGR_PEP_ID=MMETSP0004_2-20121128/11340_1 /TAXON_ID=420556 /ORGANISM="Ochromonas sp., Strain CCMP1393" /LENGTH=110 /DNA_ID=CAMNT_0016224083 /DNA_START=385 /DNA_END=713 /DNA_ORIENTATION=-